MHGEHSLTRELTAVPTPGHTPGHVSILVTSQGQRALVLGDAAHSPVQIQEPDWVSRADMDPELTRQTRRALLDRLEREEILVAAGHFEAPGFGRIVRLEGPPVLARTLASSAPLTQPSPPKGGEGMLGAEEADGPEIRLRQVGHDAEHQQEQRQEAEDLGEDGLGRDVRHGRDEEDELAERRRDRAQHHVDHDDHPEVDRIDAEPGGDRGQDAASPGSGGSRPP